MIGFDKIKDQEQARDDRIIDAVFQEGVRGGSEETKMFAEQNEGGDVPAHNKHRYRGTHDREAHGIYITEVFRGQEKRIGPECFHKTAADRTEHHEPE